MPSGYNYTANNNNYSAINNNNPTLLNISDVTGYAPNQTGISIVMYGGNDTVYGSQVNDIIQGGAGNDFIAGNGGNDFIAGQDGNDSMTGGTGNDSIYGGAGNDTLNGQSGLDYLYGGAGNDLYVHNANSGNDLINDNQMETGAQGSGGGISDAIWFTNVAFNNLVFLSDSTNLYITSASDWSDNQVNDGVIVQNYFLGGNYKIELIAGSDGMLYSLPF